MRVACLRVHGGDGGGAGVEEDLRVLAETAAVVVVDRPVGS